MIFSKRLYSFLSVFILCTFIAKAQNKPIGYWDSFLPYNSSLGIATDGTTIFNVCNQGFYTYNTGNTNIEAYSKVTGMSDLGMQCVGYDAATATAILVYANGNIDLFKNNTFYNIPGLKIKTVSGNKTVYHVYTENGIAYLSTSLGVLVIDMATHNFNESYQFIVNSSIVPVLDFTGVGDSFYAVTSAGLFRANKNNPELQNFAIWQKVDSTHSFNWIANVNNRIYLANPDTVYTLANDTVHAVFEPDSVITHIDAGYNSLYICEYITHSYSGMINILGANNQLVDSIPCSGVPVQAMELPDSSLWIADTYRGLQKRLNKLSTFYITVPGPVDANSYDIYVNNQNLWVAHGTFTNSYDDGGDMDGFSNYYNNNWINYGRGANPAFDTLIDFVGITKDETTGIVYSVSFRDGLFILKPDGSFQVVKSNSIFDLSEAYCCGARDLLGVALDQSGNLWMSSIYAHDQLYVKTTDSNWYKFSIPGAVEGGPIVIDDNGQVWFVGSYQGGGVGVYNTNGTPGDPTDDHSYFLQAGVGYGNLPSNTVFCIAKDLNNNIWIGTSNGIGIVSNCLSPFTQNAPPCDAELPIVQYDQYAGYLFAGYNVTAIAVDGANRKWVGTDNGIWLLSPDASQIIYNFTSNNSPLPSNNIQKIAVDKVTGDVYFGTDKGLVSYRSTATEGGTSNSNVTIFPDPVPGGYTGTIAIKGLVANADVRITDISGELVYRTTALGGQAVWSGIDYKGHRPQSGVYLVFVSSSDGAQTYVGKMVFIQ